MKVCGRTRYRTRDLWFLSQMRCRLRYAVWLLTLTYRVESFIMVNLCDFSIQACFVCVYVYVFFFFFEIYYDEKETPGITVTPYDCLLISVAFVVLCRVGCLWVTGVISVPVFGMFMVILFFARLPEDKVVRYIVLTNHDVRW